MKFIFILKNECLTIIFKYSVKFCQVYSLIYICVLHMTANGSIYRENTSTMRIYSAIKKIYKNTQIFKL